MVSNRVHLDTPVHLFCAWWLGLDLYHWRPVHRPRVGVHHCLATGHVAPAAPANML